MIRAYPCKAGSFKSGVRKSLELNIRNFSARRGVADFFSFHGVASLVTQYAELHDYRQMLAFGL